MSSWIPREVVEEETCASVVMSEAAYKALAELVGLPGMNIAHGGIR